jgi:hypothetical protein
LFSYIPGLNTSFAGLGSEVKRLIMGGILFLVAAGIYGLSCAGVGASFAVSVECTQEGLLGLVNVFVLAVIANQSAFAIAPKTGAVRDVRESKLPKK